MSLDAAFVWWTWNYHHGKKSPQRNVPNGERPKSPMKDEEKWVRPASESNHWQPLLKRSSTNAINPILQQGVMQRIPAAPPGQATYPTKQQVLRHVCIKSCCMHNIKNCRCLSGIGLEARHWLFDCLVCVETAVSRFTMFRL